jgi:hypothetical protein
MSRVWQAAGQQPDTGQTRQTMTGEGPMVGPLGFEPRTKRL